MKRAVRHAAVGILVAVVAGIGGAVWYIKSQTPVSIDRPPKLTELPPLAPVTHSSLIVTPVVIPLQAIRETIEAAMPPKMTGKPALPPPPGMNNAEMTWSIDRDPFVVSGGPEGLTLSASLKGALRATGEMTSATPDQGGPAPPGLGPPGGRGPPGFGPPGFFPPRFPGPPGFRGPPGFGGPPGPGADATRREQAQSPAQPSGPIDDHAEFSGRILLKVKPSFAAQWRLSPNVSAEVSIDSASAAVMGRTLNLSDEIKPTIERLIAEQVGRAQEQFANSPVIEEAVRREWSKMCRSIPLGQGAPGAPNLWLELRPTQALVAQPQIDSGRVSFALGVRADTRITPAETKPECSFPQQLEIVPQMDQGRVNIDLPIDIPFTEVSRLIEAELKGKSFPVNEDGTVKATIESAKLSAAADRLLIALKIRLSESKSWFGLAAEATIYVWGKPQIDRQRRLLRFEHIALDVESEAAFGLLGFVARVATPDLQKTLSENAVMDLAPLVGNARQNLQNAVAEFKRNSGLSLDAGLDDVRLADIRFDSTTMRVIIEADGFIRVEVTKLGPPGDGGR